MYFEDFFHPNDENDVTNHQKRELNNIKSIDPGYGYIYRNRMTSTGKFKKTRLDCYTTGDSGTNIRNAETGNSYKYKVGSSEEDLFFKVAISTGELRARNCSNILFFDSPEHYENYFNEELSDAIKYNWVEKKNLYTKTRALLQNK
jgi:hypothetical protein